MSLQDESRRSFFTGGHTLVLMVFAVSRERAPHSRVVVAGINVLRTASHLSWNDENSKEVGDGCCVRHMITRGSENDERESLVWLDSYTRLTVHKFGFWPCRMYSLSYCSHARPKIFAPSSLMFLPLRLRVKTKISCFSVAGPRTRLIWRSFFPFFLICCL